MCRKKKKDEITYHNNFTYKDLRAIEEFLEAKQQEGLKLVKYTDGVMTFKKCEPSHSKYSCEVFLDKNRPDFDKEFVEMCESGGWKFVCADYSGLYIFKTDDENVTDIMTDDKMKLSIIAKSCNKPLLYIELMCAAVVIVDIIVKLFNGMSLKQVLSGWMDRTDMQILICVCICSVIEAVQDIIWYFKRRHEMKNGEKLKLNNLHDVDKRTVSNAVKFCTIYLLCLIPRILLVDTIGIIETIYIGLFILCAVFIYMKLFKKGSFLEQSVKKRFVIINTMLIAILGCTVMASCWILPSVPDETDLAKQVISGLSIECDDLKSDCSRLEQHYDGDWQFDMYASKVNFVRNYYLEQQIKKYRNIDEENSVEKVTVDGAEYYEFRTTEDNHKYAMIAVVDDYVIYIRHPKDDTIEKLQKVLPKQAES